MKRLISPLAAFFKNGYGKTIRITAAAFFLLIAVGYAIGILFPGFTEDYMSRIYALLSSMTDESGAITFETILANNISACFTGALYGFIPFVYLSAYPLGSNAALLGLMAAYYTQQGIPLPLYILGILPHGITEIPAMVLTFALGLQLCRDFTQMLKERRKLPTEASSKKLILDFLRVYFLLILPLLIASAALETYVTPRLLAMAA